MDHARLREHRRGNVEIPGIQGILIDIPSGPRIVLRREHAVQVGCLCQYRWVPQMSAGNELIGDEAQCTKSAAIARTGCAREEARGQRGTGTRYAHHEHGHEASSEADSVTAM